MVLIYIFIAHLNSESDFDSIYYNFRCFSLDSFFSEESIPSFTKAKEAASDYQSLRISGTKDFSFDLNQGFDQGLKLDVYGEIEGLKIEGNLSDKATPAQTKRISDIEKMSLNVESKHFSGGIGDLSLNLPFNINDEIEGGRVGFFSEQKKHCLNFSYAINRGKYKKIEMDGEEGRQGPYFLSGSVIYGSERVYLARGTMPPKLLMRGKDYYIDYQQGILNFTNENIITINTRITVEYQEITEDYLKIYQESDAEVNFKEFTLGIMARRSYDDRMKPVAFNFSTQEIEELRSSGDSISVYHLFADTTSNGNYNLIDSHFVYVGEGNGNYRVLFFYVGENKGEYVYDPAIKGFTYKGEGNGDYSPKRFIIPPCYEEFYGIYWHHKYGNFTVYGTQFDRNTFSPIDDQDNRAMGYKFKFQHGFKLFSTEMEYVKYQENLNLPFSPENVNYYYTWSTTDKLSEMANLNLSLTPASNLGIDMNYGVLNRKHINRGIKLRPLFFYFGYENVDTIDKFVAGLKKELNNLLLSTEWQKRKKEYQTDYELHYKFKKNHTLGLSGNYFREDEEKSITTKIDFFMPSFKILFGHHIYNDTILLFGNLGLNISYRNLNVRGELQQSQKYSQKRDEFYEPVKKGKGNYVYDSTTNTYIQKIPGDYVKRTILLNEFVRVITRSCGIELNYGMGNLDCRTRFNYLNEENYLNHLEDILINWGKDDPNLEIGFQNDFSEDSRYIIEKFARQTRRFFISPSGKRFYNYNSVGRTLEKWGELLREMRDDYISEVYYEVIENPQIKPYTGYTYSKISSGYFANLNILRHSPKVGIILGKTIKEKGRVEIFNELIYRIYNLNEIPYFFSANEPPGLTKVTGLTIGLGIGDNTIFNLNYRIQFPPKERFNHSLKLQTRIKF